MTLSNSNIGFIGVIITLFKNITSDLSLLNKDLSSFFFTIKLFIFYSKQCKYSKKNIHTIYNIIYII